MQACVVTEADPPWHILDVNERWCELTGYSRDEVMGHNLVDEFISKEFQSSVKQVRGARQLGFRKRAIVRRRRRQC